MAQLAGTTDTYDIKGGREDLQDAIFRISPTETPFMSNIGRGPAKAVRHEWQTDALAPVNLNNAYIEGDEYTYADVTPTVRVGNLCQISRETVLVSGTVEAIDKAGRESEMRLQTVKRGLELKKDMEGILLSNQASNAGAAAGATARRLGGLGAWLTSNVSRGAGGANGGFNNGTNLVAAPTAGTGRAWTETILKDVHQATYQAGGNPKMAMMPVPQKRVFSTFPGIAAQRRETGDEMATIIAAADIYVGDFGRLAAVPNRQMATTSGQMSVFLIDPKMAKLRTLRPIFTDKPAKTGDAFKAAMVVEYTLEVSNEAAHAVIADLN